MSGCRTAVCGSPPRASAQRASAESRRRELARGVSLARVSSTPAAEFRWQPPAPIDLVRTLRPLCHGAGDPTARFVDGTFWWGCRTPDGPGRLAIGWAGELVPACLEQRVTGQEAFRAWRLLTWAYGEPAPGPAEPRLWLPAEAARLLAVPSWDWHRFGGDAKRYRAVRAAATVANRLEECVELAASQGVAA